MALNLDQSSPVPLYHQIAETIRDRIRSGDLPPGSTLEPLRKAARSWGVNLHTVRKAYASLAREGLVAAGRGRAGTRVLRPLPSPGPPSPADVDRFLDRVREEARSGLGLTDREIYEALQERLAAGSSGDPVVYVVECSEWLCRLHAAELRGRWKVEPRSWPLTTRAVPPDGLTVSTMLHYNDLRTRWPQRLARIHFLASRPDPGLKTRLENSDRALLYQRHEDEAAATLADLSTLFPGGSLSIEPLTGPLPGESTPLEPQGPPVIFPPRSWAALDESQRSHPRAVELRYLLDAQDLERLGRDQRWEPA